MAVSTMLNLFAASSYNHYAKCARLYLQMMMELPQTHPWLWKVLVGLSQCPQIWQILGWSVNQLGNWAADDAGNQRCWSALWWSLTARRNASV